MYVAITVIVAGVGLAACAGLAWLAARRSRRRPIVPAYVVTPAVPYCRVCDAPELAAAWREAGLGVVERPRAIDVVTQDGLGATIELAASRRIGDAPFVIRSHHAELVHSLAALTAYRLGPLVCWIDGYVHGFDAPDVEPEEATSSHGSTGDAVGTRSLRPR